MAFVLDPPPEPAKKRKESNLLGPMEQTGVFNRFNPEQISQQQDGSEGGFMDLLKSGGQFGLNAVLGLLDEGSRFLGGGAPYTIPSPQDLRNQVDAFMSGEQYEPEMDQKNLIATLREIAGDRIDPETIWQERAADVGETAGRFGAYTAAGGGSFGKELLAGTQFGIGERIAKESGLGNIGQLAGGIVALVGPGAAKGLLGKTVEYGRGLLGKQALPETPAFLEEVTPKSLADMELSKKDLRGRVAKTSNQDLEAFQKNIQQAGEVDPVDIASFNAREINDRIVEKGRASVLETISPAPPTKKEGWEAIAEVINKNEEAARAAYNRNYEKLEELASGIEHTPRNLWEIGNELRRKTSKTLLKGISGDETQVRRATGNILRRLMPAEEKEAILLVEKLEKAGVAKDVENVIQQLEEVAAEKGPIEVSLDKLLATRRSVGHILDKADIIPAPVNMLRKVYNALTDDIMAGFGGKESNGGRLLEATTEMFKQAQETFQNNKAILDLRQAKNPEKMAEYFTSPKNLETLNEAIVDKGQFKDLAHRMVVENIASKSTDAAKEIANEAGKFLTQEARKGLDKLIDMGDKLTSPGAQDIVRGELLRSLQKAAAEGSRPSYALDLMKTPQGYHMVKTTMSHSPKGKQMWKALQQRSAEELIGGVVDKSGQIDYEKAAYLLENDHTRHMLMEYLGKDGVEFFKNLENKGKNFVENLTKLQAKEPNLLDRIVDGWIGGNAKKLLYSLSVGLTPLLGAKSLLGILGAEAARSVQRRRLFKLVSSKEGRKAVNDISKKGQEPSKTAKAIKRFGQIVGQI